MNHMASRSNIESLPDDCVSKILSHTSPLEACRFSLVSPRLGSCADSDTVWRSFLPSDYKDIISRAVSPFTLNFSSYKQLYHALCHPLLIDQGNKSFKLDKSSGKKSYIISARELSIAWSSDPMMWSWKPIPESRFAEAAELRIVSWLEIEGKIRTRILTPNTTYAAYLIMNVCHRAYGLDSAPSQVAVTIGNKVHRGRAYLGHKDENKRKMETLFYGNRTEVLRNAVLQGEGIRVPSKREDGWTEIELGEFFSGESESDEEIKMSVREVGYQLKGGLVLEGIEVRPKT
ncbi:F-box protein PP2-B15 [Spatholobus suberectus]|nr:F-box protein PP2-B15 [Spatholobus suberectus]